MAVGMRIEKMQAHSCLVGMDGLCRMDEWTSQSVCMDYGWTGEANGWVWMSGFGDGFATGWMGLWICGLRDGWVTHYNQC